MIDLGDVNLSACALCRSTALRPFLLLRREGVPPGKPDHNIGYLHTVIVLCGGCGGGFLEVRKHDCFDYEDVWDQDEWFVFDRSSADAMQSFAAPCPSPLSEHCSCPVHQALRKLEPTVRAWTYGFEAPAHIHRAVFSVRDGRPRFTRAA